MTDLSNSPSYRIQITSDATDDYANSVILNVARGMGIEINVSEDGIIHLSPKSNSHCDSTAKSPKDARSGQQDSFERIEPPRVLISYSHDSEDHSTRVRQLSDRLRSDGVDCRIDQYVTNPSSGWPRWMLSELTESDFVLVLCTPRYAEKADAPQQSGVRFESVLLLQDLYEAAMINDKFIPILFSSRDAEHIHKWLRPYTRYMIGDDSGYDSLLRRLIDDPMVPMPPIGVAQKKGPS